jgi:hypothetical protein
VSSRRLSARPISRAVAREHSCPICNADFPLNGDEVAGDEVYCSYCGAPCRLTAAADDEACEVEEDF